MKKCAMYCNCMHAPLVHMFVGVCACMHVHVTCMRMHACMLVACILFYKIFPQTVTIS